MSVALQIRDVPEPVRDVLAARARANGQSLQAFLLALVEAEARRSRNVELVARFEDRSDGYTGDDAGSDDIAETVAQLRAHREAQLADGCGDDS